MPRGEKSGYTDKQQRQTEHSGQSYEKDRASKENSTRREWSIVNKTTESGKKSVSGPSGNYSSH